MEKKTDKKMVIGMILLAAVFLFIGGSFWSMVSKQAQQMKEEEAEREEAAISAIYIEKGDLLKQQFFVDMERETVFTAHIPAEGIYNKKGKLIEDDVLETGDLVKIYGDNIMTRSLPAQYPGVTKIQRDGRASLEETQKYQKLIEELGIG